MQKIITQAAKELENGGIVSLPTETVYSISANACNDDAVDRVYRLKGRRKDNPLALLVGNLSRAREIVEFNENAEILVKEFFPGPLTLILPRKPNVNISPLVNEGLNTLAIRMPDHKMTLDIISKVDFPVIGTSANPSGEPAAVSARQVREYFGTEIDLIVDGGSADIGIASTIVDLCGDMPVILRQGSITAPQLDKALGIAVKIA